MTSQKWKLRFQIGEVLQFCIYRISAKYHILTWHLQTFEEETFGIFDVLIGYKGVTWLVTMETLIPKYFWNNYYCFYQFPKHTFKGNKVIVPIIPKLFVPITRPRNLLAVQVEKKNPACQDSINVNIIEVIIKFKGILSLHTLLVYGSVSQRLGTTKFTNLIG